MSYFENKGEQIEKDGNYVNSLRTSHQLSAE